METNRIEKQENGTLLLFLEKMPFPLSLEFDFNCVCEAEQVSGCNLMAAVLSGAALTANQTRALLYAFLKKSNKELTLSDSGSLFEKDMPTVMLAVSTMVRQMFGATEEDTEEQPTVGRPESDLAVVGA